MKITTWVIIGIIIYFAFIRGCESPTIQEGTEMLEDTIKDTLGRIQVDISLAECLVGTDCEISEECVDRECVPLG